MVSRGTQVNMRLVSFVLADEIVTNAYNYQNYLSPSTKKLIKNIEVQMRSFTTVVSTTSSGKKLFYELKYKISKVFQKGIFFHNMGGRRIIALLTAMIEPNV